MREGVVNWRERGAGWTRQKKTRELPGTLEKYRWRASLLLLLSLRFAFIAMSFWVEISRE